MAHYFKEEAISMLLKFVLQFFVSKSMMHLEMH